MAIWTKIWKRAVAAFGAIAATASLGAPVQAQAAPARSAAAPQVAPVAQAARPALWRIRDRDTTIYLFGTIHALPEGLHWHTPAFDRAMAASGELVMELSPADLGTGAQQAIARMGMAANLPPILDRVPADKRERLQQVIAQSGVPAAAFDRMKSWMAGVLLAAISFQHMGLAAEQGVERDLTTVAGHRPAIGLETATQQISYLDGLSEDSQRALLVSATDDPATAQHEFHEMMDAWTRGDVDAIARSFNTDESMTAELRRTLLTERNGRWADWLQQRMARPGTVFVAVGAGHLAGAGSVIAQLEARGVHVDRVQ